MPSFLEGESRKRAVGFYVTFDGGGSDVLVGFDDEVHAVVFVFKFELDFAEVVVLFKEIITGLSEVIKFWWSHFEVGNMRRGQ